MSSYLGGYLSRGGEKNCLSVADRVVKVCHGVSNPRSEKNRGGNRFYSRSIWWQLDDTKARGCS